MPTSVLQKRRAPELKKLITEILTRFQNGQLTLPEATDRLLTEKNDASLPRADSDRRLKNLHSAATRAESSQASSPQEQVKP